jgi:protein TonB
MSLAVHGVVLAAAVIVPLLSTEAPPEPAFSVRAFLVEPMAAPPPPPPPPPAARAAARPAQPRAAAVTPAAFLAPVEVPTEVRPDEGLDLGGGVAGGVEGGVPGGVVGGVVGGLPDAAPRLGPVRVGGFVREPRKLRHVDPGYPDTARKARVQGIVIIEATIDTRGAVVDAKILRGVPILDQAALDAVRQWAYTPTLIDGVATPVVMTVTVSFRLRLSTTA